MVKKKSAKNKAGARSSKEKKKEAERQTLKFIGFLAALVVLFFISKFIFGSALFGSFEYEDLTFTKEKFGDLDVYRHYYNILRDDGSIVEYNLYLRRDPRRNDVEYDVERILFPSGRLTLVSVNGIGLEQCEYNAAGIGHLAAFLSDNGLSVRSASPRPAFAGANDIEYADCTTHPANPVIVIQEGEETKITQDGNLCYVIDIADCEVLEAIEKFEVLAVLDARES